MKYYVNVEGLFLGAWNSDGPQGAVEVPSPPLDSRQKWLGDSWGPIPTSVPPRVSRRQGRLALLYAGLLPQVEAAMAALEDATERMAAQIEYEAETWERNNQWIERTGEALGLSTEQIDALFIEAYEL